MHRSASDSLFLSSRSRSSFSLAASSVSSALSQAAAMAHDSMDDMPGTTQMSSKYKQELSEQREHLCRLFTSLQALCAPSSPTVRKGIPTSPRSVPNEDEDPEVPIVAFKNLLLGLGLDDQRHEELKQNLASLDLDADGLVKLSELQDFMLLSHEINLAPDHPIFQQAGGISGAISAALAQNWAANISEQQMNATRMRRHLTGEMSMISRCLPFEQSLPPPVNILYRALTGKLVILDWEHFCNRCVEVYSSVYPTRTGQTSSRIPQLKNAPDGFAVSICTVDGQVFGYGDCFRPFTLQECHKPFSYSLAVEEAGEAEVLKWVDPAKRKTVPVRTDQPSSNRMDAIMLSALIAKRLDLADLSDYIIDFYSECAASRRISFDEQVYQSEKESLDRSNLITYFKSAGSSDHPNPKSARESLDVLNQCCSVSVTCDQLAVMAAMYANGGVNPISQTRCCTPHTARLTMKHMLQCGLGKDSAEWALQVGQPACSSTSGALFVVIPNVMGVCVFSPKLNESGNSVRALDFLKQFCSTFSLGLFDILMSPGAIRGDGNAMAVFDNVVSSMDASGVQIKAQATENSFDAKVKAKLASKFGKGPNEPQTPKTPRTPRAPRDDTEGKERSDHSISDSVPMKSKEKTAAFIANSELAANLDKTLQALASPRRRENEGGVPSSSLSHSASSTSNPDPNNPTKSRTQQAPLLPVSYAPSPAAPVTPHHPPAAPVMHTPKAPAAVQPKGFGIDLNVDRHVADGGGAAFEQTLHELMNGESSVSPKSTSTLSSAPLPPSKFSAQDKAIFPVAESGASKPLSTPSSTSVRQLPVDRHAPAPSHPAPKQASSVGTSGRTSPSLSFPISSVNTAEHNGAFDTSSVVSEDFAVPQKGRLPPLALTAENLASVDENGPPPPRVYSRLSSTNVTVDHSVVKPARLPSSGRVEYSSSRVALPADADEEDEDPLVSKEQSHISSRKTPYSMTMKSDASNGTAATEETAETETSRASSVTAQLPVFIPASGVPTSPVASRAVRVGQAVPASENPEVLSQITTGLQSPRSAFSAVTPRQHHPGSAQPPSASVPPPAQAPAAQPHPQSVVPVRPVAQHPVQPQPQQQQQQQQQQQPQQPQYQQHRQPHGPQHHHYSEAVIHSATSSAQPTPRQAPAAQVSPRQVPQVPPQAPHPVSQQPHPQPQQQLQPQQQAQPEKASTSFFTPSKIPILAEKIRSALALVTKRVTRTTTREHSEPIKSAAPQPLPVSASHPPHPQAQAQSQPQATTVSHDKLSHQRASMPNLPANKQFDIPALAAALSGHLGSPRDSQHSNIPAYKPPPLATAGSVLSAIPAPFSTPQHAHSHPPAHTLGTYHSAGSSHPPKVASSASQPSLPVVPPLTTSASDPIGLGQHGAAPSLQTSASEPHIPAPKSAPLSAMANMPAPPIVELGSPASAVACAPALVPTVRIAANLPTSIPRAKTVKVNIPAAKTPPHGQQLSRSRSRPRQVAPAASGHGPNSAGKRQSLMPGDATPRISRRRRSVASLASVGSNPAVGEQSPAEKPKTTRSKSNAPANSTAGAGEKGAGATGEPNSGKDKKTTSTSRLAARRSTAGVTLSNVNASNNTANAIPLETAGSPRSFHEGVGVSSKRGAKKQSVSASQKEGAPNPTVTSPLSAHPSAAPSHIPHPTSAKSPSAKQTKAAAAADARKTATRFPVAQPSQSTASLGVESMMPPLSTVSLPAAIDDSSNPNLSAHARPGWNTAKKSEFEKMAVQWNEQKDHKPAISRELRAARLSTKSMAQPPSSTLSLQSHSSNPPSALESSAHGDSAPMGSITHISDSSPALPNPFRSAPISYMPDDPPNLTAKSADFVLPPAHLPKSPPYVPREPHSANVQRNSGLSHSNYRSSMSSNGDVKSNRSKSPSALSTSSDGKKIPMNGKLMFKSNGSVSGVSITDSGSVDIDDGASDLYELGDNPPNVGRWWNEDELKQIAAEIAEARAAQEKEDELAAKKKKSSRSTKSSRPDVRHSNSHNFSLEQVAALYAHSAEASHAPSAVERPKGGSSH